MRGRLDSVLVLLAALVLYLLTGQRTLYGVDGWRLLRRIASGDIRSDMHLLYKPLAAAATRGGELLGLPMLESVVALSGIGTALGVALLHAATRRLGGSRSDALWLAALAGTAPGVWFYATVVERHGPFFAFVGLAAWALAGFARRPGVATAVGFATTVALAYAAHSTGILLTAGFLPLWAWWQRTMQVEPMPWRRIVGLGALAGSGAAVLSWLARRVAVWLGTVEQESGNLDFFLQHAEVHVQHPELVVTNLAQEYLWPFLPLSVLAPAVFLKRGRRPGEPWLAAALGIAVLAYAALSFAILGGFEEHGAYALPVVFPLAFATVRCWTVPVRGMALVVAVAVGAGMIVSHDVEPLRTRADGLRALAGDGTPFLLAAAPEDFALLYGYFPTARFNRDYYDALDAHAFDQQTVEQNRGLLVQALQVQSAGRPMFLSRQGEQRLLAPADEGKAGGLILEVLREGFRFEAVEAAGFRGYAVRSR